MIHGLPTLEENYIPSEDKSYLLEISNGSLSYEVGIYNGEVGE